MVDPGLILTDLLWALPPLMSAEYDGFMVQKATIVEKFSLVCNNDSANFVSLVTLCGGAFLRRISSILNLCSTEAIGGGRKGRQESRSVMGISP